MASISNKSKGKKKAPLIVSKSTREIGASGTDITSGIITEDYNADLQFPQSVSNYEKMRKGDSQVQAAIDAVCLPLETANWTLEMNEEGDERVKELVDKALFEHLEIPFEHFISEALTFLPFGFKYFEKVFKMVDGMVVWEKFAPRQQSSHLYWKTSEGKGSGKKKNEGVTQQLKSMDVIRDGNTADMQPETPMNKILLFTNKKEGDNFEGTSILRSAYKHWKMKDLCYKIQMISNERYGVGVPTLVLPSSAGDDDIEVAENILKNLRSNEKSYMVLKEGWEFDIKTPTSDAKAGAIKETIDHHNRMILMSVLAPFLDLGSSATGSYSLGETQMSFFINSLQRVGKYMAGVINTAIKELVEINFGPQEHYPTLRVTEIGTIDKQVIMNALAVGVNSGIIVVDSPLRAWVRENLNLPEENEEEVDEILNRPSESDNTDDQMDSATEEEDVDSLEGEFDSQIADLEAELSEIL